MNRFAVAAVALCLSTTAASADSRAWTAAKKVLPADLQVVVGMNFAPIRSSELFKQYWPTVASSDTRSYISPTWWRPWSCGVATGDQ